MTSHMDFYKRYLSLGDSLKQGERQMERLEEVMSTSRRGPINTGPVLFMSNFYCGSRQDVNDDALLRKLGITHVIDCAASASRSRRPEGIKKENYLVLDADDNEKFPIIKVFFAKVKSFLDMAVKERGRVMVHCELGMNRSVTLCLAYKLASDRCKLFHAVREFSAGRPNILTNRGFRRQLIDFATQHNLI